MSDQSAMMGLVLCTFLVLPAAAFAGAALISRANRPKPRNRVAYQATMTYDLGAARIAHEQRTGLSSQKVQRLDREFRRWFVVAAASPTMIGMGSRDVDEYWHTLLEVEGGRLYAAFSEATAGRIVQHVEGVGSEDLDAKAWVGYQAVWGKEPPADLFPRPSDKALSRHRATATTSSGSSDSSSGGGDLIFLAMISDSGNGSHGSAGSGSEGGSGGSEGGSSGGDSGGSSCGGGGCGGG